MRQPIGVLHVVVPAVIVVYAGLGAITLDYKNSMMRLGG